MNLNLKQKALLVARAGAFAMVAIGGLSIGLTITTYTVAKANDLVFADVAAAQSAPRTDKLICS